LNEYRVAAPDVIAPFETLGAPRADAVQRREGIAILSAWTGLAEAYAACRSISIDYAIAEKCRRTAVVAGSFDWIDIGSWDDYARFLENAADGDSFPDRAPQFKAGASNCFVDSDLPVALCGVDDLIVVVRSGADGGPPAVLVCKKGQSQKVRDAVEAIKAAGRADLL
jgi:mannose-1-phosphate guanylyltransferase/mannose-1-phosphate guanylyltransferase/mannose-6-phosphate isomerase